MRNLILSTVPILFLLSLFSCHDEPSVSVSNFEPTSGDYRTEVVINGSNFSTELTKNEVYFGNVKAKVISATPTQLQITVPPGAPSSKILIKANDKETISSNEFKVTSGKWSSNGIFKNDITISSTSSSLFTINNIVYIHNSNYLLDNKPVDATFWAYDATSKTTIQKKELNKVFSSDFTVSWATSAKGYMFSGDELWEYDPALNGWEQKTAPPTFPKNYSPGKAFYLSDTKRAYVLVGDKTVWVYDPSEDTWGRLPDMPFSIYKGNCLTTTAYKAFFIESEVSETYFWHFDSSTLLWKQLKSYPGYSPNFMFNLNDEIYVGSTNLELHTDDGLWKYDAVSNEWIQKASCPIYRRDVVYFTIGQNGFIGMGVKQPGDYYVYDFYKYDPN